MKTINWEREPFFGGCNYFGDNGVTVKGYYSPSDPLEFEGDCKTWTASNIHGASFESSNAAMEAAERGIEDQAALLRECRLALADLLSKKPGLAGLICGSTTLGNLKVELYNYRPLNER